MADSVPPEATFEMSPAFASALRARGLDTLPALMDVRADRDLAKPGLATWRHRVVLEVGGQTLFVKRYEQPPLLAQWSARGRGFAAVAQAEWHWLHHLRELAIPVPEPVAFGYERARGRERRSVVVTAAVPGRSIEQWIAAAQRGEDATWLCDVTRRAALSRALAQVVRRLHAVHLFHRDLYVSHIFLDPQRPVEEALTLIDLQRVVRPRWRWRRRRWAVKDLASLNYSVPRGVASNADRVRWFKQYRYKSRLSRADKRLIRLVVAKTEMIARHDARRRRRRRRRRRHAPALGAVGGAGHDRSARWPGDA